jgi:hypothetical protein
MNWEGYGRALEQQVLARDRLIREAHQLLRRYLDNHCQHADAEGLSARCDCTLCRETRRYLDPRGGTD